MRILSFFSFFICILGNGSYLMAQDTLDVNVFLCPNSEFQGILIENDTIIFETNPELVKKYFVQVYEVAPPKIIGDSLLCLNHQGSLTAGIFNEYSWSTGSTSPTLQISEAGTYSLTVTDVNACQSSDSIQVESYEINAEIHSLALACFDSKAQLQIDIISSGVGPILYLINDEIIDKSIIEDLPLDSFLFTIQDQKQCALNKEIIISRPPSPVLDISAESISFRSGEEKYIDINLGDEIETLEWTPRQGLSCFDCPNPLLIDPIEQYYSITGSTGDQCKIRDSVFVSVNPDVPIFFPNIMSPSQGDLFCLEGPSVIKEIISISIFDRWGNTVFNRKNIGSDFHDACWNGTWNDKIVQAGVYVFIAEVQLQNTARHLIKSDLSIVR